MTTAARAPGARSTQVLVPSRVIGPGLGARSSVTQPGKRVDLRAAAPMRRGSYVALVPTARRGPDVRSGHRCGHVTATATRTTRSVSDLGDDLDLDRRAQRQLGDADRAAGVPALLAQHVAEEVARRR